MKLFKIVLPTLFALLFTACTKTEEHTDEANHDHADEASNDHADEADHGHVDEASDDHADEADHDHAHEAGMEEGVEPAMYASLDGLEMRNASTYGNFVFGGQPTAADLEALKARGVTKIVDLRTAAEDRGMDEPAVCEELGLEYVAFPFSPASFEDDDINGILEAMQAGGNTLVHCGSGNRVQLLFTMHRVLEEGADVDAAMALGREHGMSEGSEKLSRQLLSARE